MQNFISKLAHLLEYQRQIENYPKISKRSLTLVMLEMMKHQIDKHSTHVEWAHITITRFWNMPTDENIKQCWTQEEWTNWLLILLSITRNLPVREGIAKAA